MKRNFKIIPAIVIPILIAVMVGFFFLILRNQQSVKGWDDEITMIDDEIFDLEVEHEMLLNVGVDLDKNVIVHRNTLIQKTERIRQLNIEIKKLFVQLKSEEDNTHKKQKILRDLKRKLKLLEAELDQESEKVRLASKETIFLKDLKVDLKTLQEKKEQYQELKKIYQAYLRKCNN
ncbi:hypothetical protein KFE98_20145 [bacterium SCSIO 12741]|nr:hypothetical protein KFE98_20145 [bacterium SCSIO 12741]